MKSVRADLVIAVCALLISSLATAASWWQTRVVQQQLAAQVWPYVGVSETIDNNTARISLENDGLGPAVLRSVTLSVDGRRDDDLLDVLHKVLGAHILRRLAKGENMGLDLGSQSPGSVLRVGDSSSLLALRSKRFARRFVSDYQRLTIKACYCSIVPGTCWVNDSSSTADPQPIASCPEIPGDLLHARAFLGSLPKSF